MNYAKIAIGTGSALFLIAVVAGFSFGFAHNTLMLEGDAMATLHNLQTNIGLFRGEIAGWLVIFLLDLLVSFGICYYFRSSTVKWSITASTLRIAYSAVLGGAIVPLFMAERLVTTAALEAATAMRTAQYIDLFEQIWSCGLILFGVHLMALGWVNFKSQYGSRFWGALLMIAGLGYSLVHTLLNFPMGLKRSTIETIEQILMLPMILGELGFAGWLIWKGIKAQRVEKQAESIS
jgi:hypothetical protein